MAYRVIDTFADLKDNGYVYNKGDVYPRAGKILDEKRAAHLASDKTNRRKPVLEWVEEKPAGRGRTKK